MSINGPQLHLMLNHLPVVGFILLTPILALTAWRGDTRLKQLTLLGTVAIALLSLPAFWTGEPAEDGIEHLQGVAKHLIHEHEEAAEKALTLGLLTGAVALGGYFMSRRKDSLTQAAMYAALTGSILTSLAMGKTAHEGGKIRHPEIAGHHTPMSNKERDGERSEGLDRDGERHGDRHGDHDKNADRD